MQLPNRIESLSSFVLNNRASSIIIQTIYHHILRVLHDTLLHHPRYKALLRLDVSIEVPQSERQPELGSSATTKCNMNVKRLITEKESQL